MGKSRFNYIENLYNGNIDMTTKGFLDRTFISQFLDGNETVGTVLKGMAYRPDKVAAYYYGDQSLFWIISAVNNFDLGIQDYYEGRTFYLPTLDRINTIL